MTREFWDSRARLGNTAGTQDHIAKELAMRELQRYLGHKKTILDIGCGNGQTAEYLIGWEPTISYLGLDFSPAMIAAARERCRSFKAADFSVWDLLSPLPIPTFPDGADIAITERVLINLPDWETQQAVIRRLLDTLKPGGVYLMIENSRLGLAGINEERTRQSLPTIEPPAHTYYLYDHSVMHMQCENATVEEVRPFTGYYYYCSRIVNARDAADRGEAPQYDSPINLRALEGSPLPLDTYAKYAQGKLWVWRKHA